MSHETEQPPLQPAWENALKSAKETTGLADPAGTFLRLESRDSGPRIVVVSDGMKLADKEKYESAFREALQDHELVPEIYFKRVSEQAPQVKTAISAFGLTREPKPIPGVDRIIAVGSGKGGVGKSTVTANLAMQLAKQGRRVGLLDADFYGPSAPLMFGAVGPLQVTADDRLVPITAHGVKVVSFGFLAGKSDPLIWRGPLVAKAMKQFCYEVDWGELDDLLIDLPPGTGDVQITMVEQLPITGAIVVSTPQNIALADAYKAVTMFEKLEVPLFGIVENMAVYTCSACGHAEMIFGESGVDDLAVQHQLDVLARLPLLIEVRSAGDAGLPVTDARVAAAFAQLAQTVMSTNPELKTPAKF